MTAYCGSDKHQTNYTCSYHLGNLYSYAQVKNIQTLHFTLAKESNPFISELSLTPHLTSTRQVTNKASTRCHQQVLSADEWTPPSSSSIQLFLSLLLCCSCPCFPGSTHLWRLCSAHVIAVLDTVIFFPMYPMNFHLLFVTSSPTFSISAISVTSLLVILSCQHILSICLRHLF